MQASADTNNSLERCLDLRHDRDKHFWSRDGRRDDHTKKLRPEYRERSTRQGDQRSSYDRQTSRYESGSYNHRNDISL